MNPGLKKLVDQQFMTEAHGLYIEEVVSKRESIIVSGHKGWGILPLLATIGTLAKERFTVQQVKDFESLEADMEYFVIASPKEADFAGLVSKTMAKPGASLITLKDPDHPYSLFKMLQDTYKATGDASKVYHVLECAKINDEKKLAKVTRITIGEGGKLIKVDA